MHVNHEKNDITPSYKYRLMETAIKKNRAGLALVFYLLEMLPYSDDITMRLYSGIQTSKHTKKSVLRAIVYKIINL